MSENETVGTAMVVSDHVVELSTRRAPTAVLAEAQKAAQALTSVLQTKKNPVMINGQQYLEFEDWLTIAAMYSVSARVVSTEYVEFGDAHGFSAKAVAMRSDGMEISAAESMCLNDEDRWNNRPLFQLKSMAQTRACAKVLRNVLSWVVVLGGYGATPAEEMDGVARSSKPRSMPSSDGPTAPASTGGSSNKIKTIYDCDEAKKKPGKVIMEDGREGTTFDKKLIEKAHEAKGNGQSVEAVFTEVQKGDKTYRNLTALEVVIQLREDAAVKPAPAEVITTSGAETVVKCGGKKRDDDSKYWYIQTDARGYWVADKALAEAAMTIHQAGGKVIIDYVERVGSAWSAFCALKVTEAVPASDGGLLDAEVLDE